MTDFAIYSRCSSDLGDRERHVELARAYVDKLGHELTDEFIDIDVDPMTPWDRSRPKVAQLLDYASDHRCTLDGVVVPSPFDAFAYGGLLNAAAILNHLGLELHLVGHGPVHPRTRRLTELARRLMTQKS